jgi:hypothetical protein
MANNYRQTPGYPGGMGYPNFPPLPGYISDRMRPYGHYGGYYSTLPNQVPPSYM